MGGRKAHRNNPEGSKNLAEVKRLLFAGKPKEAEELADKTIIAFPRRMPPYQTLGDLHLRFSKQDNFTDYRRELDLDTGMVRISYRSGDTRFTREVFSSRGRDTDSKSSARPADLRRFEKRKTGSARSRRGRRSQGAVSRT
jgi:hypothetical protein